MNRRAFLKNAAVAAVAAPVIPAAIARATEPRIVRPSDFDCPLKQWICISNPTSDYDWLHEAWMRDAEIESGAVQPLSEAQFWSGVRRR